MLNLLKKSFKEHKISILSLLLMVIILIVLDIIFSNLQIINLPIIYYFGEFHNSYLQGIITNIFGALIVLFFLETFIKDKEKNIEIENIKKQIYRSDKVLNLLLEKYISYAKAITNPEFEKYITLEEGFDFKRLSAIFNPSLIIIDDSLNKKAFDYYFETQKEILNIIKEILINLDFRGNISFLELEKLFLSYIDNLSAFNLYDAIKLNYMCILKDEKTGKETGKMKDIIVELIKTTDKPEMKTPTNMINLYVLLYNQINYNLKFIKEYNIIIENLKVRN